MCLKPRLILLSFSVIIALSLSAFAQGTALNLTFDFRNGDEGWQADFSDYPPATNQSGFYELQAGIRSLPPEISASGTGFFFQGSNHSADLFMFMKRRLGAAEGIVAGTRYQITYTLTMASNTQSGCVGIGGAPGESVYIKAGASPYEPLPFPANNGWLIMNVDKGNQAIGGTAASVAGNIANGKTCNPSVSPYVTIQRVHKHTTEVVASPAGELWLLVGTDSGFEGRTSYYYQNIKVNLTPMGTATAPTLLTYPNTTQALALDSVTFMRDAFPSANPRNFSADGRTRVMLFARDLELSPGEDASAVTAEAEDLQHRVYPLTVEYVGKVRDLTWLTQVNIKLPDEIYEAGGCWITIRVHGLVSNRVLVSLKPPSGNP